MLEKFIPGLEGVPIAESSVSFIDGKEGILEYRGISIEELAEKSSFVETAHLLLWGKLPNREELNKFNHDLMMHRRLKFRIIDLIKCLPESGHPMDALQAAVAALGMFYPDKEADDVDKEEHRYMSIIRLIAKLPTIVASFDRIRHGDEPILPRDDLGHSPNFLYMLTEKEPTSLLEAKILDICLILHAEHTMNASTFAGRVTGSTLADPYTVVCSAIGALTGPLHGGANEEVLHMLKEIGSVERVRPYIENRIKSKQKIMGMGHRVYKTKDPRAKILQKLAEQLLQEKGESELYSIAREVEDVVGEHLGQKGIYSNVDFYSGIVYDGLGIPADLFTCIFAMARVVGWLAHWLEQLEGNRIYRPTQIYTGGHNQPYIPIDKRG